MHFRSYIILLLLLLRDRRVIVDFIVVKSAVIDARQYVNNNVVLLIISRYYLLPLLLILTLLLLLILFRFHSSTATFHARDHRSLSSPSSSPIVRNPILFGTLFVFFLKMFFSRDIIILITL